MISIVVRFANDMVATFDENGEQIPEYQGSYKDVRDKILKDAPPTCKFEQAGIVEVSREDW